MGVDISSVQNESILNEMNESINNYKDTIINRYNINIQTNETSVNDINIVLEGVTMGNLNVEQTAYQNALIEIVNACSAALKSSSNAMQKNQVKEDLINEAKKEAGLFSMNVSKTANKSEIAIANKIKNDFINEITNEINNEFKNVEKTHNKINLSAKNSNLGNVDISETNKQIEDNKTQTESKTENTKSSDIGEGSNSGEGVTNKEESKTGMSSKIMLIVAIMVVIVVAFAAKAAVDPNLGKNVSQFKGGNMLINKETIFVAILIVILIVIAIYYKKTKLMDFSVE